jgi:hypothetical protein
MKETTELNLNIDPLGHSFDLDPTSAKTNLLFLTGLFAAVIVGIGLPVTREFTKLLLAENNLVEVLTFIVFLVGGGFGLHHAYKLIKAGENLIFPAFFIVFSVGLIFIGMEEISWGQQFLGFETPEPFRAINEQQETTLHNINGMSGNSEYLRLLYGIGGAFGVLLISYKPLQKIAVPFFLLPWFLLIAGHAVVDVFNDIVPIQKHFDALISELAELVEMLIGFSAMIYIYFKIKEHSLSETSGDAEKS